MSEVSFMSHLNFSTAIVGATFRCIFFRKSVRQISLNPVTFQYFGDIIFSQIFTMYKSEDGLVTGSKAEGKSLLYNFIFMSVCFSANHGSVTSVIALASSFNPTLGSYSVGVLYGCYVLTAMLAG
jgi:hypothetical protein